MEERSYGSFQSYGREAMETSCLVSSLHAIIPVSFGNCLRQEDLHQPGYIEITTTWLMIQKPQTRIQNVVIEISAVSLVIGWPQQHTSWIMHQGGIFGTERRFKLVALVVSKNKVGRHRLAAVVEYHRRALREKNLFSSISCDLVF